MKGVAEAIAAVIIIVLCTLMGWVGMIILAAIIRGVI